MAWMVCSCGCAAEHPYGEENPVCWQCGKTPQRDIDYIANPAWWHASLADSDD